MVSSKHVLIFYKKNHVIRTHHYGLIINR